MSFSSTYMYLDACMYIERLMVGWYIRWYARPGALQGQGPQGQDARRGPHGWSLFIATGGARCEKGDFNVISGLVFLGRAASLVQGCTLYRVVGLNFKPPAFSTS